MDYKVVIQGALPSLNEIIDEARRNRYASAEQKKKYTDLIAWHMKKLPQLERIDIVIVWHCDSKRKDKDNIMAGQKFILDGMVEAGVIKNDGWSEVGDIRHEFAIDKNNPRIEVLIRDISEKSFGNA